MKLPLSSCRVLTWWKISGFIIHVKFDWTAEGSFDNISLKWLPDIELKFTSPVCITTEWVTAGVRTPLQGLPVPLRIWELISLVHPIVFSIPFLHCSFLFLLLSKVNVKFSFLPVQINPVYSTHPWHHQHRPHLGQPKPEKVETFCHGEGAVSRWKMPILLRQLSLAHHTAPARLIEISRW